MAGKRFCQGGEGAEGWIMVFSGRKGRVGGKGFGCWMFGVSNGRKDGQKEKL